jgi:protocatechuate 3,4-dioxygenase beta subunit
MLRGVKQHDDFGGLARDLETMSRRRMLGFMAKAAAGLTLAPLIGGCGDDVSGSNADANTGGDGGGGGDSGTGNCARIPGETAGPFPGDGTNGPNALTMSGINRSDIRASIGAASGVALGVDLKMTIKLVSAGTCQPLVGYAVYLWHCTREGDYSMYTGAATSENFLRGVQVTDANGEVSFTTIFPGCYPGRWPHMHFEVYSSLASATNGAAKKAVSQLALPKAANDAVYTTAGYETSATYYANTSVEDDGAFRDDATGLQMAAITGSVSNNFTAALTVAIAV